MDMTMEQTAVPTTEPAEQTAVPQDPPAGLTVKFNKQEYQLSAEEAVNYAQMGMKFQSVQPVLDKLKTLAGRDGQSLSDFVDALCGEEQDVNQRLAREFCALREECPEVESFTSLPESVVQQAVESGTPLTLAYLRYCYGEHTRIRRAEQQAASAAAASAGTQQGAASGIPDPAVEAMLRGVWQ